MQGGACNRAPRLEGAQEQTPGGDRPDAGENPLPLQNARNQTCCTQPRCSPERAVEPGPDAVPVFPHKRGQEQYVSAQDELDDRVPRECAVNSELRGRAKG